MEKKKNHYTRQKYQNSNTFKSHGGEKNSGKSKTVQDESYTVRELLEKHANGLMPQVGMNPQYDYEEATHDDDVTFRKPDLDLTDIDEISLKVKKTHSAIKRAEEAKRKANDKSGLQDVDNN